MARISSRIGAIAPPQPLPSTQRQKHSRLRDVPSSVSAQANRTSHLRILWTLHAKRSTTPRTSLLPRLRSSRTEEGIAEKTLRDSGVEIDPSQVVITNGGKQAVYQAFATVIDEGDDVLLPAPYWTTYPSASAWRAATPSRCSPVATSTTRSPSSSSKQPTHPATKALIFVSLQPDRCCSTPKRKPAPSANGPLSKGIFVLTDEIYEHLTYDGVQAVSILKAVPELADLCVILNGVVKTYAMTGWRGWMIGPRDVIAAASNLQSHMTSNVNNIAQRPLAALDGPQDDVEIMHAA